MVRVPSAANSSHLNMETGNFGKKDSVMSKGKISHKGSYEVKDIVPTLIAPRLNNDNSINQRINTEISQIRGVSNPSPYIRV